jgi:hypothetical protein
VVHLVLVLVGQDVVGAVGAEAVVGAEAAVAEVEAGAVVGAGNQTACYIILNLRYLSPVVL